MPLPILAYYAATAAGGALIAGGYLVMPSWGDSSKTNAQVMGEGMVAGAEAIGDGVQSAGEAIGGVFSNSAEDADREAESSLSTATTTEACATCGDKPCQHLACGVPGSAYRGGAHWCMTKPTGDGKDSHHMPARSVILPMSPGIGPSIQMDPRDHQLTNSYGGSVKTNPIMAGQQRMVASGNFVGAQAIDVVEVAAKFPGKYDAAILQMELYTGCLKKNGLI